MGSIMAELPAMVSPIKNPKFIMFSDFDGTITMRDSNDYLSDNYGFGPEQRRRGSQDVVKGKIRFRDYIYRQMQSVKLPLSECIDILLNDIQLDPYFNEFFQWGLKNNIPTVVVSSGMEPVIRALLKKLVGPDHEKIYIISNGVDGVEGKSVDQEGGWELKFRDDSDFGHDKSTSLRPYADLPEGKRPTLFYAGDGVSDLCAARETDLLFAKKGLDLVTWCAQENIPFTLFADWSDILDKVKEIVAGDITVEEAAAQGFEAYKVGGKNGLPSKK